MWIYGNGGHAKVIRSILKEKERSMWFLPECKDDLIVIDDKDHEKRWKTGYEDMLGLIAIGDNAARQAVANRINHAKYAVLKASGTTIQDDVFIDLGTVMIHGAVVNAGSSIGRHVILNTNSSVDHDCEIGAFAHIGPGATVCGGCKVGEGALIGAGAVLCPGVVIPPWALVKAGTRCANSERE